MSKRALGMRRKLLELIRQHPGLSATELTSKGWRPQTHGSFRNAELAGEIEWSGSGWYIKGQIPECPIKE